MKKNKQNSTQNIFLPVIVNIKSKKYDEAIDILNQLIDRNQDQNIIDRLKASIYLKKEDWKLALSYYEKIVDKENSYDVKNNMGVALYRMGRLKEACIKFEESINLNKSYLPAYENIIMTNKLLGNYELSIKFILEVFKFNPNNKKVKNIMIDILNYFNPKNNENYIIGINYEIKKLNLKKKNNKIIQSFEIRNILQKAQKILNEKKIQFSYPETQIFKKNKLNLNCKRHLDIFNLHKIIPKFCFNCYKVQIVLSSIKDLIKLYFYFNNLFLEKNNIRKCIIELRKNISGNYKGYIFTNSIKESEEIMKIVKSDLLQTKISIDKIEIKHGCTEYYSEYKLFKNINQIETSTIYQNDWNKIETKYDDENYIIENNEQTVFNDTINEFNLSDFLIIKNWLLYAKVLGDHSYKEIFNYNVNENLLSNIQKKQISLRKLIN